MGHQIIQQPDGKLCVWSTIVDALVVVDATPDELIEMYALKAAQEARERTRRIIDLVQSGQATKAYHQFTMTYDEAIEIAGEEVHRSTPRTTDTAT
jgi:hypothetical protein